MTEKRNKWKRAYDIKCAKLLGMPHQSAMAKLERMWLFELIKEKGLGDCYHCGFPVESDEDMSTEHINPWGGNTAKNICADVNKFWDIKNLRISHKRCNSSAACGGSGYYKYIGVHPVNDRHTKQLAYSRASISVNSKDVTLGHYDKNKPQKAAIAYDIALMIKFKGIGKLNFPYMREEYEKELRNYNVNSPAFWVIRTGPIKKIVEQLYPLLKEEDKNNEYQGIQGLTK